MIFHGKDTITKKANVSHPNFEKTNKISKFEQKQLSELLDIPHFYSYFLIKHDNYILYPIRYELLNEFKNAK